MKRMARKKLRASADAKDQGDQSKQDLLKDSYAVDFSFSQALTLLYMRHWACFKCCRERY